MQNPQIYETKTQGLEQETEKEHLALSCTEETFSELFDSITSLQETDSMCVVEGIILGDKALLFSPVNLQKSLVGAFVYSHGQDELIDKNAKYRNKLFKWGKIYVNNGYIFVASDLDGNNWGNERAILMLKTIVERLTSSGLVKKDDINLLAFSMGGLAVYRYITKYPETINRIIILAGTFYSKEWSIDDCKNISLKTVRVYHGNNDVNVPLSMSRSFYEKCQPYVKDLQLTILNNTDHWKLGYTDDVDILLGEK